MFETAKVLGTTLVAKAMEDGVVFQKLLEHAHPSDQKAIIEFTSGSEETPLNAVRPCGMEAPPNEALDMNGSSYLIIGYLLKSE